MPEECLKQVVEYVQNIIHLSVDSLGEVTAETVAHKLEEIWSGVTEVARFANDLSQHCMENETLQVAKLGVVWTTIQQLTQTTEANFAELSRLFYWLQDTFQDFSGKFCGEQFRSLTTRVNDLSLLGQKEANFVKEQLGLLHNLMANLQQNQKIQESNLARCQDAVPKIIQESLVRHTQKLMQQLSGSERSITILEERNNVLSQRLIQLEQQLKASNVQVNQLLKDSVPKDVLLHVQQQYDTLQKSQPLLMQEYKEYRSQSEEKFSFLTNSCRSSTRRWTGV